MSQEVAVEASYTNCSTTLMSLSQNEEGSKICSKPGETAEKIRRKRSFSWTQQPSSKITENPVSFITIHGHLFITLCVTHPEHISIERIRKSLSAADGKLNREPA